MSIKRIFILFAFLSSVIACQTLSGLPETTAPDPTEATTSGPPDTVNAEEDNVYELFDESTAPDKFTIVRVGQTEANLEDILRLEAQKAVALNQDPYVEFSTVWCPPCRALKKSFGDELMIEAFEGTYIIQLDLDQWEKTLPKIGFYVPGVPAFYEIDSQGQPTGRMITGGAWGEDIPENIAPPMREFFDGRETSE